MATFSQSEDRRIQRTRQLLRQASIEVMQEKGFRGTSIQDITERANVNRGTFYTHFSDKYALLESLLHEEFQELISTLPPTSQWDRTTLQQLIELVLEDFKNVHRQCHPLGIIAPLIERTIQQELADVLLMWLKGRKRENVRRSIPEKLIAQSMSRVIMGAALEWSQEPDMPATQLAHHVLLILMDGVEHLTR